MKKFPFNEVDLDCSVGSNLDHVLYVFEGYRAFVMKDEDTEPYAPGTARDVSWKIGYNKAKEDMTTINFYTTKGDHGCFSNFSRHPVKLDGHTWMTSEHYFQAMKFAGTSHESELRKAASPMEVARMGRDRSRPLRKDWDHVKDDVMRKVVYAKFTQHENLKKILLDTGDAKLVEHTENDNYWADGGDGSGKNMLGVILMEVRERIRKEENV